MSKQYKPHERSEWVAEWDNTRFALENYEAGKGERDWLWEEASRSEDPSLLKQVAAMETYEEDLIKEAFWMDAKEVNSLHDCLLLSIDEIREIVLWYR